NAVPRPFSEPRPRASVDAMSTTRQIAAALVGLFISACSFDVDIPPIGTGPSESMGSESSDSGEDSASDGPGETSTSGEGSGSGSSGTTEIGSGSGDGTSTGSSTGDLPVCEIVLDSMPGADGLCVCDGEIVDYSECGPCEPTLAGCYCAD